MKNVIDIQKKNLFSLFELIKQNQELPIVPMVDYEIIGGDNGRWLGEWGNSHIGEYMLGEDRVYFRDDKAPSEMERVVIEKYGYGAYEAMSWDEVKKDYAEMPWIKAIIINIDLPRL